MRSLIESREASFGKTNRKCARKPLPANRTNLPRLSSNSNVVICLDLLSSPTRVLFVGRLPRPSEERFLSHRGSAINLRQVILDQKVRRVGSACSR